MILFYHLKLLLVFHEVRLTLETYSGETIHRDEMDKQLLLLVGIRSLTRTKRMYPIQRHHVDAGEIEGEAESEHRLPMKSQRLERGNEGLG